LGHAEMMRLARTAGIRQIAHFAGNPMTPRLRNVTYGAK
jgi:hypothetical protein